MKKLKNIFMIIVMAVLVLPVFAVAAEEEKEPVNVYIFRSDTCIHCQNTMKFLEESKEEYGKYYEVHDYEVSNAENAALYKEVAEFMGDSYGGVPYMVVGKYTYPQGFEPGSSATADQTMGEQLIERIMEIYNSDDRYDVMKAMSERPNYDVIVAIVAGVIIVGLGAVVVISRRQNKED